MEMVKILQESKLLPDKVNNTSKAMAILLKGKELGFGVYESFQFIDIIQNQPTLSAAGKGCLLKRAGIEYDILQDYEPITDESGKTIDVITTIQFYSKNNPEKVKKFSFKWSEACNMGLKDKDNWKKMPKRMMLWRCLSGGANFYYPDLMHRMYTPEELGFEESVELE